MLFGTTCVYALLSTIAAYDGRAGSRSAVGAAVLRCCQPVAVALKAAASRRRVLLALIGGSMLAGVGTSFVVVVRLLPLVSPYTF